VLFRSLGFCVVFTMLLGLSLAACGSDASTICEKLQECNALQGVSVEGCEENVEKNSTDSQRADCADCMDGKTCETIGNGECNASCL